MSNFTYHFSAFLTAKSIYFLHISSKCFFISSSGTSEIYIIEKLVPLQLKTLFF